MWPYREDLPNYGFNDYKPGPTVSSPYVVTPSADCSNGYRAGYKDGRADGKAEGAKSVPVKRFDEKDLRILAALIQNGVGTDTAVATVKNINLREGK